jgi:hypothetical protein
MMGAASHILGLAALACLVGGMVFFGIIMAPLVFTRLDAATAGRFIRATFPRYYLYVLISAALGAAAFAATDPWAGLVLAVIAVTTLWLRQGLMPHINRLRDAELAGDAAAARAFARAHRLSVLVNQVQLLAALGVVARVGLLLSR